MKAIYALSAILSLLVISMLLYCLCKRRKYRLNTASTYDDTTDPPLLHQKQNEMDRSRKNKDKKGKKTEDPDVEKLDHLEESFEYGIENEEQVGIVTEINS